jgi:Alpha galactosidase A/Alpha galactosidase C-terminal beta sandwich domain
VLLCEVGRPRCSTALPAALALLCAACVWAFVLAAPAAAAPSLAWSPATDIDGGTALNAISCPSLGLCVAVDGAGRALVSTHPGVAGAGSWSPPFAIDGTTALTSISCASTSMCLALDGEGRAVMSTHPGVAGSASWSAPFPAGTPAGLTSISCASPTLCAAVDGEGHVAVSTEPNAGDSGWHRRLIDPGLGLVAVSCFAPDSCVAIDSAGNAFASPNAAALASPGAAPGTGATWSSTAFDVFGAPAAISCAASGLCVALDGSGYAFASDDAAAAPPVWAASGIDLQPATALKGVSCVTEGAGLCAAVDARGRVLTAAIPAPVPPQPEAVLVQPHPSIAGTPAPGQALTCRSGVSASGVTLAYDWLRDTRVIAGTGGPSYLVSEADVSHHLQCRVTATTAAGSASATSGFVSVPAGGLGAISETFVGALRVGRYAVAVPLTCSAQAAGRCKIALRLSVLESVSGHRVVALAAAAHTRRVTLVLGARTVYLSPRQRFTATVALGATGRRLLAHAHRLAVRLTVSGTVVGAISASLKSATVIFGAARKASLRGGTASLAATAAMPVPRSAPQAPHAAAARHATPRSIRRLGAHLAGGATSAAALAPTPYMGWDTYFTFGGHFDEGSVLEQASQLLTRGLASAGYRYVWLDAGWWQGARDSSGAIVVNPAQWPHGMAWLARTLHAAGFRVGIYTDAGSTGCGGPTGSYGHYQQDVNTFAAWGFDAVKVDFCGGVRLGLAPAAAYGAFHEAIVHNSSHRPMLLSICNFLQPGQFAPEDPTAEGSAFASYSFGPSSGNSWRTNTDLGVPGDVRFANVLANLDADATQPQAAGPGHWNDPDYLGPDQGMTAAQFRTQQSMWAMLAAPLMVSADLITLSSQSQATIANREAIAIDQDPAGVQARLLAAGGEGQVWVKPLSDGSRAVALLNRGAGTLRLATNALAAGMPSSKVYTVRNAWTGHLSLLPSPGTLAANVPAYSTVLLRVSTR